MTQKIPLSRKWKLGILGGFISISLALLFIPYPEEHVFGYFDPYDGISRPEGSYYYVHIPIQWRSHSQNLKILLNVSIGKVNMTIMDSTNYLNWYFDDPYTPLFHFENITYYNNTIHFQPSAQTSIVLLIISVEDSIINPKLWFTHLIYHNNYAFFFTGIAVILGIYYLNQIVHKKLNFV